MKCKTELYLRVKIRHKFINLLVFAQNRWESHDDRGQGRFDVLISIWYQVLDTGQDAGHDNFLLHIWGQRLAEVCHTDNTLYYIITVSLIVKPVHKIMVLASEEG